MACYLTLTIRSAEELAGPGEAVMVEPFSDEYLMLMEHKKIPVEAMKKLPQAMHLIKVVPTTYDYLDSDLKKDGFGSRQHLEV
jgi:hypothetical protein